MNLITMAHIGEAQGVIDLLGLERSAENLYESQEHVLLITGEGPFEAATSVSSIIQRYKFNHAYNFGIAGALDKKLEIASVHPVRSIYLVIDGKPHFKTFQLKDEGVDCLTSFERILNSDKAKALQGLGELVDREAWGVAFACKQNSIPFSSFKIISDQAGSLDACELVKSKATYFAELLANQTSKILNVKAETILEGFHFTFSTKIQFEQKIEMLILRTEKKKEDIISELRIDELRELKILPKERTKLLIQRMDQKLDPLREKINDILSNWKQPWNQKGITIQTDPTFEDASITLSFKASSDAVVKDKLNDLNNFTMTPYLDLREGHVE